MGIVKDSLYQLARNQFLPLVKRQPIFPYYHIVRDEKVAHIENLYPYKNTAQFKSDVGFLLKNYKPIGIESLPDAPENAFLLSFDDGLEEIYSVIFPILKEKNVKAIFFINPDFVDNTESLYKHDISVVISHLRQSHFQVDLLQKIGAIMGFEFSNVADFESGLKNTKFADRNKIEAVLNLLHIDMPAYLRDKRPYISSAQIQEMLDAGFYFGGHTMSHPPLIQLSEARQKEEIINSIEWLKTSFGIRYSLFAFPFSDKGISRSLIKGLFEYDKDILIFGNSGLKKDFDKRIIQRFSLENPSKEISKQIVSENLYKFFNKITRKYRIKRPWQS